MRHRTPQYLGFVGTTSSKFSGVQDLREQPDQIQVQVQTAVMRKYNAQMLLFRVHKSCPEAVPRLPPKHAQQLVTHPNAREYLCAKAFPRDDEEQPQGNMEGDDALYPSLVPVHGSPEGCAKAMRGVRAQRRRRLHGFAGACRTDTARFLTRHMKGCIVAVYVWYTRRAKRCSSMHACEERRIART